MAHVRGVQAGHGLAFVLLALAPGVAAGATQSVHTKIEFTCSDGRGVAGYDEFATVRVELAGVRLHAMLNSLPEGSHVLRVVPEPPGGGAWVVTEIKFFDVSDGSQQNFAPHAPEAQVTLKIGPRRAGAISTLTIGVDQCGKAQARPPIVFLPGVGGTELYENTVHRYELWPLAPDGNRFRMMLDRDGIGGAGGVRIGRILRSGLADFYGDFVSYFVGQGYVEGKDFFTLPYDWRLDPDSPAIVGSLQTTIDEALAKTGASKVVLTAHSLGGVIARAFLIDRPATAAKVEALVTMGSPYWGNVHPFYALVDGYNFGNHTVAQKTMKILGRNFPSPHFLTSRLPFVEDEQGVELSLPETMQIQYRGFVKGPGGIDDYQAADGLIWNLNPVLLARANAFWARMGTPAAPTPLPAGVKHYVILGHGIRTFHRYKLHAPESDDYIAIGARKVRMDPLYGDGDITVPIWSSQIRSATATYYMRYKEGAGGSKIGRFAPTHGDLTKLPRVQSLVWDIVRGAAPEASSFAYLKPSWLAGALEYVDFTLRSDAHLSILDEVNGGRLGFAEGGRIEESLDGGTFLAIGDAEHATLANFADRYKVRVAGLRDGKFTLEIRIGGGPGQPAALRYPEVPVKPGTLAELELVPSRAGASPPALRVTTDGRTTEVPAQGGSVPPAAGGAAGCAPLDPIFENDTNRYGGDYRSVELRAPCPENCAEACRNDNRCKAWSFVRPGFESAGCWLKDGATTPTANACCVSGTYTRMIDRPSPAAGAAPTPPSAGGTAPTPPSTGGAAPTTPPSASGATSPPPSAGVTTGGTSPPTAGRPAPAAPAAPVESTPCPSDFRGHRGRTGPLSCHCSALASASGSVYGDDPYTDDSTICRAAVHAGVVTTAGGDVRVYPLPGRPSYGGSTRHGVTSSHWHAYDHSFSLSAPGSARPAGATRPLDCPADFSAQRGSTTPLICYCDPSSVGFGSAYGTDVYTDDSRICAAALHAGAVTKAGGVVRVEAMPGQASYAGSRRNGFTSESWGGYHSSFRVTPAER